MAAMLLAVAGTARAADTMPAIGPLRAEEIAVVFNTSVPASRELAEYYVKRRGLPDRRLIGLRLPDRDTIDRGQYAGVARQLRSALREAALTDRVRCLVLLYGMPIRVGPVRPGARQTAAARDLEARYEDALRQIEDQSEALEALALSRATSRDGTRPAPTDLKGVADRFAQAKAQMAQRLQRERNDQIRASLTQEFFTQLEDVEGSAALLAQIRTRPGEGHPSAVRRLEAMRELVVSDESRVQELLREPPESPRRDEARSLIRRVWGLLGTARNLQEDRQALLGTQTNAALDSELTLLWWDDFPLYRWRLSPIAWRVRSTPALRQAVPSSDWGRKVLMVSRLDGPTPAVVRRMIDDAIAAERSGLQGTFYIDARGITRDDGYRPYDQNLRDLAALMKARTSWPTVIDDRPALFGPGECPDTALYCGWYSLRRFVPAFSFAQGAVGYHIASSEAVNLRDRGEQGWCKRMLEEGIAATLGPVDEPYLHAFPLPRDFFGLLLSGRFTLAECYAYSNNFNSWMMILLGDPLYRPFAGRPLLDLEDAFSSDLIPSEHRRPIDATTSRPAGPKSEPE